MRRALLLAVGLIGCVPAVRGQQPAKPAGAATAKAPPVGDSDPEDRRAVIAVCAACHPVSLVEDSPRPMEEWQETVQAMVDRGAKGTDEQFGRVMRYLELTMSTVNVNTAPADMLQTALGLSPTAAQAVVEARGKRKLASLDELGRISGVDPQAIAARKKRIFF